MLGLFFSGPKLSNKIKIASENVVIKNNRGQTPLQKMFNDIISQIESEDEI